jgi:hypothetical protein
MSRERINPYDRVALATDFGLASPYIGQIRLKMATWDPSIILIDLISDLPPCRPDLAAYLLPALVRDLPSRTIYLTIVDPGVGGERMAIVLEADGNLYVGPDNGLLAKVARRARQCQVWRIDWRPSTLSPSFHGRDLFAPAALAMARGESIPLSPLEPNVLVGSDWPDEMSRIVYQDTFGNLMLGVRAAALAPSAMVRIGGQRVHRAQTFCEVSPGQVFWYENAFGLVELAVNQGSAAQILGLRVGDQLPLPEVE